MRELKFRAWYIRRGQMEQIDDLYWFYFNGVHNGSGESLHGNYVIMQYTGLKDMNGNEIYEGDLALIKENRNLVLEVVYRYGSFKIKYKDAIPDYGGNRGDNFVNLETMHDAINVIGNIHQNPELVQEKVRS